MPSLDTTILRQLVRARRACLERLRDMGRRQLEYVDAGQVTSLLDVLTAKQRPLQELQQVERALDPFRGQDPEARRWSSPEDRARCAADLQACEQLLQEIIAQEKHSEAVLVRRRDETAVKLQGVHLASQARGAYLNPPPPGVSHIDLLSER
jgi:hypothetical protein